MRQREQRGLTRGPYRRLAYEGIASASIWSDPHVEAAKNAALGERDRHRCAVVEALDSGMRRGC